MAITQVGTTVEQGITYGLSKWCDVLFSDGDWKPSELAKYSWCRWRDKFIGCCDATSTNINTQQGPAVTQLLSYFNSSLSEASNNYVAYYNDNRIPTNEPYCFNILMYGRNGDLALTSDNAANYRVVTSCSDFQSLYVLVNRYQSAQSTINVSYPTARTVNCNNLLWADNGVYNTINNAHAQWITVWTVFVIDEDNFFVTRGMAFPGRTPCMYDGIMGAAQGNIRPSNSLTIGYGNRITDSKWYYYYGDITNYQKSKHLLRWYKNGITGIEPQTWGDSKYGVYDVDDDVAIIMRNGNAVYGTMNINYTYYLKSEEAVKNAIAYTGLRWRYQNGDTEHIYTPIIDDDGYITGYSTDPAAETKLNDIDDVTGNNISPLPPAPPTPGSEDDPWSNIGAGLFSGSGGAFLSVVTMTSAECEALALKLNSIDVPTGFDPMPAIMGLKYFPFSITGGTIDTVKFGIRKGVSADYPTGGSWDTGVGCKALSETTMVIDLGYVDVPNRMNERGIPFLDYDTVYEAYIPFCGVFPLDTNFITGRRLHAYLYVDVISGNCTGIIYALDGVSPLANGIPVAMGSGSCSVEVPVSSNQYGLAKESLLAAGVKSIFAIGTGAAQTAAAFSTGNAGNAIGAGSSFWEAGTRILRAYTSLNNNLTTCTGISGDQSAFFLPTKAYIKIVRPKYIKDTMYNSSCGIPVGDSGTLPTGYSMAINPEVNAITEATDEERSLIYNYLVTGVYKK